LKPTVGRISRHGIVPITLDQDTAGPMARTVRDVAILFAVLEGDRPDPKDPATGRCPRPDGGDYTTFLDAGALRGARLGVPRAYFVEAIQPPGETEPRGGLDAERRALFEQAIAKLRELGAEVIDPTDLPSILHPDPERNFLRWPVCHSYEDRKGRDAHGSIVLKYGMKRDFERWLESLGPAAPVRSLTDLRRFNLAHQKAGAIQYGQARLDISDEMDGVRDRSRYLRNREKDLELAQVSGLDAVFQAHRLDAVVFPANLGADVAARAGYPSLIVPAGFYPPQLEGLPPGFEPQPAPFGITFTGPACSEPRLLALGFAFEQATHHRKPPREFP
jgi:amidase